MRKQYQFYLSQTRTTGIAYSIASTTDLAAHEIALLKRYLAKPFEIKKITQDPWWKTSDNLMIIGPNLRHATPESDKRVDGMHRGGLDKITQVEVFHVFIKGSVASAPKADRMREAEYPTLPHIPEIAASSPKETIITFLEGDTAAISQANAEFGIGLTQFDIEKVIMPMYKKYNRDATLSELFTVAVVNSEHGRHHSMQAQGTVDGNVLPYSLFDLIKEPYMKNPGDSVVAFGDNSSALERFDNPIWINSRMGAKVTHLIFSAETHNYPTTIEAFHGALTGTTGEERDIWAMGRGAGILMLVAGYAFGNLELKDYLIPGEGHIIVPFPTKIERPLDIAMKAPRGVACGGNETGYPTNAGYTRSFGATDPDGQAWSFWKTQLFAGAAGIIYGEHLRKQPVAIGMHVYMIGGPAYLIGMGGSQSSSKMQGENNAQLDWNGIQRGNPLMSRKLAEVMQKCMELGEANPIVSVHDQGAGGIGNVLTELVAPLGARLDLAKVTLGDTNMTPSQIWTAEYQERLGMVIKPGMEQLFEDICAIEKLNCECLGKITGDGRIVVVDSRNDETIIDLVLEDILGTVPRMTITDTRSSYNRNWPKAAFLPQALTLKEALFAVLKRVEVGSKDWHLRYKDHSVLGKTVTHQYTGVGQVPINDYALSLISQHSNEGAAVSVGEQPIMMILDPAAGTRMAILEAFINSAGVVTDRSSLQANEMVSLKVSGEYARTVDMLKAANEMLIELGDHIDGGKDSTNMTVVVDTQKVISPPQLVVSRYATVSDVTEHVPAHFVHPGESQIMAINFSGSARKYRLGGSPYLTVYNMPWNGETPDVDTISQLPKALAAVRELIQQGLITACHDTVGDGLLVSVLEMALAGGCGARIFIDGAHVEVGPDVNPCHAKAFAQEGWLIIEHFPQDLKAIGEILRRYGVESSYSLGLTKTEGFTVKQLMARQLSKNLLCHIRKCGKPTAAPRAFSKKRSSSVQVATQV